MKLWQTTCAAMSALALAVCTVAAQEADRKVAGGGITAKGWQGKVDAAAAKAGKTREAWILEAIQARLAGD